MSIISTSGKRQGSTTITSTDERMANEVMSATITGSDSDDLFLGVAISTDELIVITITVKVKLRQFMDQLKGVRGI
jgi:hypothetical protein